MPTTLTELNQKLDALAEKRVYLDIKKDQLKRMEAEVDALKQEIVADMEENSLKTYKNDRLSVSYTAKPSLKVSDPVEVLRWLDSNGFEMLEYASVDARKVKPILEQAYKRDGEIPAGTQVSESTYITVREVKQSGGLDDL